MDFDGLWQLKIFFFRWGEDGYVRISREDPSGCGVNNTPMDGTACEGGPGSDSQKVKWSDFLNFLYNFQVCGECGILFEATYPLGASQL
jgi:hypothetical protein